MREKVICLLLFFLLSFTALYGELRMPAPLHNAFAEKTASDTPQIFAPGVISGPANDGAPTFTPDGNTMFFTRSGATWAVILESHRVNGRWSEPQVAPFSGEWNDLQPELSPDGSFLIFSSWRPATPGVVQPTKNPRSAYLWRVNHTASGWSEPVMLPATVNLSPRIFKPSIAANGSIYFMELEKGKKFRIFRSQYKDGTYQKAEPLPFSDGAVGDVDPEIAPDESFLLFSSDGRRPGDDGHEHIYVVFKKADAWGAITPIHFADDDPTNPSNENESHLSPDHSTLYFSSDRSYPVHFPRTPAQVKEDIERMQSWDNGTFNVWFLPLAPLLDEEKAGPV